MNSDATQSSCNSRSGRLPSRTTQPTGEEGTFGAVPFGAVPFGTIPFGAVPFGAIPFGTVPFGAIPFGTVPFGAVPFGLWVACPSTIFSLLTIVFQPLQL
jgi:hypothetical protein